MRGHGSELSRLRRGKWSNRLIPDATTRQPIFLIVVVNKLSERLKKYALKGISDVRHAFYSCSVPTLVLLNLSACGIIVKQLKYYVMKVYVLLLIGVILAATACERDPAVSDQITSLERYTEAFNHYQPDITLPEVSRNQGRDVTRTIVFQWSSGIVYVVPNPDYCGDFSPPLQIVADGSGIASHLGLLSVINLACVDELGNFISPVYGFMTAANGDEIHSQMGAPYPDLDNPPNFYYPYTIIGGTGRFEGASGNVTMYGITDFVEGVWDLTGEGEITY
jgi:hypothetical protein